MKGLRLAFALTVLAGWAGNVQAAPNSSPQAEVLGHLAAVFATQDPARISHAFRDMGDYGAPAADIVESTINSMGYELLENGEIEEAIKVFTLNTGTFPASANAWDSLAEANVTKGDHEAAIRCYRVSLELNKLTEDKS
jgi:tetratricopeptide (TPR) repeat protein